MIDERFIFLGVLLSIIGGIGYLKDTLKGSTKPNKVTWFLWSLAPLIAFFAQISQGVGLQSLMAFSVGFIPLIIFFASFINKNATWKISRFDIVCGTLSLLGLSFWGITHVGNVAIFFSILSDGLAAFPTIIKAYNAPETETPHFYLLLGLNALITLLTIKIWTFEYYGFPLYMFICCTLIYILAKFKIGKYIKPAFKKTS